MFILQLLNGILWTILCLCFLLLLLLFLLLIFPIHYHLEGEYEENKGNFLGKVSWLFWVLQVKIYYKDTWICRVRFLGITLYDSQRILPHKKQKKAKLGKNRKQLERQNPPQKETTSSSCRSDEEHPSENFFTQPSGNRSSVQDMFNSGFKKKQDQERLEKYKRILEEEWQPRPGIWDRVKHMGQSFFSIPQKCKTIFRSAQDKLLFIQYYYELLLDTNTQVVWKRAKKRFYKLVLHFLPRFWRIQGTLGFSDPSVTGQIMAIAGISYPLHRGSLQVIPDFTEEKIAISAAAKGKFRIATILFHTLLFLCHKDCFVLIKLLLAGPPSHQQNTNESDGSQTSETDNNNCNG